MKDIIKIILNIFDFFTQQKIIKKIRSEFKTQKSISLIDVGSHKGEYISSIKKNFDIKQIYGFEPNKDIFEILNKNFSSSRINLYNKGISNEKGEVFLNKNIESSSSSINDLNLNSNYYKKKFRLLNFFNLKKITTKIKIEVIRLDEFMNSNNIKNIDLLKIDTEGFEYNVLKSLGSRIFDIKLVHFEHHFDDMIIKNYNLSDIHSYLINKGFNKVFKVKMKFRKSFEYIYANLNFEI
tara:strand:- start:195 stop:908 length:714 start_codon:yes stop_codon:yes gene_type:complete